VSGGAIGSVGSLWHRSFDGLEPEEVEWLRPGVPVGNVTTVAGDGGLGKSMLVLSLSVEIARAGGRALIVVAEDGAQVARLRLEALVDPTELETVLSRLHFVTLDWGDLEDGELPREAGAVKLPSDGAILDAIAADIGDELRLIAIDPWAECLDDAIDTHQAKSLRSAIAELRALASRRRLAVVVVAHLNKSSAQSLKRRIDGSGALYDGSRSVFLFGREPSRDDEGDDTPAADDRRVLAHDKANFGERVAALVYRVEPITIPATETRRALNTAKVAPLPGETTSATVASLLADVGAGRSSGETSPKNDAALELALDFLRDGLEHERAGMLTLARALVSERTFERALADLVERQIVTVERRGFPATAYYRLAVPPRPDGATDERLDAATAGATGGARIPSRISGFDDALADSVPPSLPVHGATGATGATGDQGGPWGYGNEPPPGRR
jgi:archaellum biogenesis ATPase FlaH